MKFTEDLRSNPDLTQFFQRAVDTLHHQINLYGYDLVVMPESSSRVNQYMLRYIYRFAQPSLQYMEQIKSLSTEMKFKNVLVVDDVTTSGSTLNEILRALRILNEDNNITLFSLIGRKDLMADAI